MNRFDKTALLLAFELHHDEVTKTLVEAGPDIDKRHNNENTMLMMAADTGNLKMAELLLELGANPDLTNNKGQTALIHAATKGHDQIVILLLKKFAKADKAALIADEENRTAYRTDTQRSLNSLDESERQEVMDLYSDS